MFRLLAEADKLRGILQAITAVNHEAKVRFTPTKLYIRAVNLNHNFTGVVHLDHKWFENYSIPSGHQTTCTIKINLQEIDDFDERKFVCIYRDERTEPGILDPPLEMKLSVLFFGINPLQTCFFGFTVGTEEVLDDTPLPEDDALENHNFKLQIHPKDLIHLLEHAIDSIDDHPNVSIEITDWSVTLSAGGTVIKRLQVCSVVVQKVTCRIEFDASRGLLGHFLHLRQIDPASMAGSRPRDIRHTINIHSSSYTSLLMALTIAESVFIHFTPDDVTKIPSMFECIGAAAGEEESSAPIFYYILTPPE